MTLFVVQLNKANAFAFGDSNTNEPSPRFRKKFYVLNFMYDPYPPVRLGLDGYSDEVGHAL